MNRKWPIIGICCLLFTMAGCGSKQENYGKENKSKAFNFYKNALAQTNSENAFKANIYVSNDYKYTDEKDDDNDYEHESELDFNLKENNINDTDKLEFKVDGSMSVDGQKINLVTYMKDKVTYNTYSGYKYKQSYDSDKDQTNLVFKQSSLKKSQIRKAYYSESNGVTIVTFLLSLDTGKTYLSDSLDSDQLKLVDLDNFDDLRMTIKIGKDGYLKEMKTEIDFKLKSEKTIIASNILLKIDYRNFETQKIDWPDFSQYQELNQ